MVYAVPGCRSGQDVHTFETINTMLDRFDAFGASESRTRSFTARRSKGYHDSLEGEGGGGGLEDVGSVDRSLARSSKVRDDSMACG